MDLITIAGAASKKLIKVNNSFLLPDVSVEAETKDFTVFGQALYY